MSDCCVYCGEELSIFERIRSECWSCQDVMTVTYADDFLMDCNHFEEDQK